MFAFVLIQLAFDFLIGAIAVFYFLKKVPRNDDNMEIQIEAALKMIEHKAQQTENELAKSQARLDAQLARLVKLCDQAALIVERGALSDTLGPSVEENELKSAVQHRDVIPTLKQIEKTKERLHQDLRVDLRSLLRDQLI